MNAQGIPSLIPAERILMQSEYLEEVKARKSCLQLMPEQSSSLRISGETNR